MTRAPRHKRRAPRFWCEEDAGKFHWSDYWQSWSRVVSVQITATGLLRVTERDTDGSERTHGTELGLKDLIVAELPPGVEDIP